MTSIVGGWGLGDVPQKQKIVVITCVSGTVHSGLVLLEGVHTVE